MNCSVICFSGVKKTGCLFIDECLIVYYLQMRDETKNKDKSLDLQQLEEQHNLLKLSVEMACDEHNPLDLYISQLNEQIDAKRHNLARNKLKWLMLEEILKPFYYIMIFT